MTPEITPTTYGGAISHQVTVIDPNTALITVLYSDGVIRARKINLGVGDPEKGPTIGFDKEVVIPVAMRGNVIHLEQ